MGRFHLSDFYLTYYISIETNVFANNYCGDHRAGINSNINGGGESTTRAKESNKSN